MHVALERFGSTDATMRLVEETGAKYLERSVPNTINLQKQHFDKRGKLEYGARNIRKCLRRRPIKDKVCAAEGSSEKSPGIRHQYSQSVYHRCG